MVCKRVLDLPHPISACLKSHAESHPSPCPSFSVGLQERGGGNLSNDIPVFLTGEKPVYTCVQPSRSESGEGFDRSAPGE